MRSETKKYQIFTRRGFLLGASQLLLGSILSGRLYYLQVLKAKEYQVLAEQNRINVEIIPPQRGRILDATNIVLADNQTIYRLFYTRYLDPDFKSLTQLKLLLNIEQNTMHEWIKRVKKHPAHQPFLLRDYLSWEEVALLSIHTPDLPGLNIITSQSRLYKDSEASCHLIGYVGLANEKEAASDPMATIPGFRVGKVGLEKTYDHFLRGHPGLRQTEVNAKGRLIRELKRQESKPGKDLHLTILESVQKKASEALGNRTGCIVLADCQTGAIRAMVSKPCYDPNLFIQGLSSKQWQELSNNPDAPLKNRCVTGLYSPGSTFKMIVALAGLKAGLVKPHDTVFCPGYFTLGSHSFRCWRHEGHGEVSLTQAIERSCDTYFYQLAQQLGITRIAEMARLFDLGKQQGIDLPEEKCGIVPDENWKKQTLRKAWYKGETIITGIGQGYMTTTPLQLTMMVIRLATGRLGLEPYLAEQPFQSHKPYSLPLAEKWLTTVRQGMYQVVNSPTGTAFRAQLTHPLGKMAGKTGTVQVARLPDADKKKNRPEHLRDHAVFVGYAPFDSPQLAITVLAEHAGSGSEAAAPVARDIIALALDVYQQHNLIKRPYA